MALDYYFLCQSTAPLHRIIALWVQPFKGGNPQCDETEMLIEMKHCKQSHAYSEDNFTSENGLLE